MPIMAKEMYLFCFMRSTALELKLLFWNVDIIQVVIMCATTMMMQVLSVKVRLLAIDLMALCIVTV